MKGEVLVKARPRFQYDMSGKANMYFEPERGSGGSATPTKRERLAGLAGGLVGVMGGLTGKHRSLGSLLGGIYAGGAQGTGLARGLAGKTVSRARRAELKEQENRLAAQAQEEGRQRFEASRINPNPFSVRARNAAMLADEDERLAQAGSAAQQRAKMTADRNLGTTIGREQMRSQRRAARQHPATARAIHQMMQRGATEEQINQLAPVLNNMAELGNIDAFQNVLATTLTNLQPNMYNQVGTPLGQQVQPLQTAPNASTVLGQGEQVPEEFDDHSSQDQGLAAQLGQQVAEEEEEPPGDPSIFGQALQQRTRIDSMGGGQG